MSGRFDIYLARDSWLHRLDPRAKLWAALLAGLRELGIHTAIETCGACDWPRLERVAAGRPVSRRSVSADEREQDYYREVLQPLAIEHFLYAIVRAGSRVLGQLSLYRGGQSTEFSARDEELLQEVLHYLGEALAVPSPPLAVGVLAVSGIFLLLYKTKQGRAFRAIAEDPDGARLVGIPILRTGLESYALSGVLGGVIAVLLAMLLGYTSPGLGEQVAHKVLAVSIIAGLGNLPGGLVVGLALGIIEALIQGYISGSWSNGIAFVVLLIVMLFRPKGLFGIKL